jgi:hypothetical protein
MLGYSTGCKKCGIIHGYVRTAGRCKGIEVAVEGIIIFPQNDVFIPQ